MLPQTYSLPTARFDVNLLPLDSRQIGTDKFKTAVIVHFARRYAESGVKAIVAVDDSEVTVLLLPNDELNPVLALIEILKSGQIRETVPLLESLLKGMPTDIQLLYNLGIAYNELGQFDEAVIKLKRVVGLAPLHAHAWAGIGVAYQRMGKLELALEATHQAFKADSTDGHVMHNYATALLQMDKYDEAVALLRASCDRLPEDVTVHYRLATALELTGVPENVIEADHRYQELFLRWPDSPAATLARDAHSKISVKRLQGGSSSRIRPDVVLYLSGAIKRFEDLGIEKAREVGMEIALKGQTGLDIHNSATRYTLDSLEGSFSGLHLLAIMYAACKVLNTEADLGVDFQLEYAAARVLVH